MTRPWQVWLAFGSCLGVVLLALGWISKTLIDLDRRAAELRYSDAVEERTRLALWRIDTELVQLLSGKVARPLFSDDFASGSWFAMEQDTAGGATPTVGPLPPEALLYFAVAPGGRFVSPQVPFSLSMNRETTRVAETAAATPAASRLKELARLTSGDDLRGVWLAAAGLEKKPPVQRAARPSQDLQSQTRRNLVEFENRSQVQTQLAIPDNVSLADRRRKSQAFQQIVVRPVWIGGELLLLGGLETEAGDALRGCWLDWPAIKRSLLTRIADLLPQADLVPSSGPFDAARTMAAAPIRLEPGKIPPEALGVAASAGATDATSQPSASLVRVTLAVAWGCVLLAAAAVAVLLQGALALSERRAAFVSAVTHELRTPLTTFRLYTDLLAEGMVADEAARTHYLHILQTEAARLTHLVGNVLAYARLERNAAAVRLEAISLDKLFERCEPRLRERAEQSGLELEIATDLAPSIVVEADPAAVEQILFNLVDNACKYAASAADRRLHLELERRPTGAALRLRDHGPGIGSKAARRLFRPFSKSATDAAQSAPGVGLGLALSRRMARTMRGDLRLVPGREGATFELLLPSPAVRR